MPEWLKWTLVTFGALLLGYIAKFFNWFGNILRFRTKDKLEEKKIESEIREVDSKIKSDDVEREIKLSQGYEDLVIQLRVELTRAHDVNEKLQMERDTINRLVKEIKYEYQKREEQHLKRIKELEDENVEHEEKIKELSEQLLITQETLQEKIITCADIEKRLTELSQAYEQLKIEKENGRT